MRAALLAALALVVGLLAVAPARAQQTQSATRYVAVTIFDVPYQDRAKVMSYMEEYFLPGWQLDPHTKNFRMLVHNWGSDGSQIVMMAEYDSWADIEGDCGKPCDDYFAKHPQPEEGTPAYEAGQLFAKYYSKHHDEIYNTQMRRAVVEGKMQGTVGPQSQNGQ